MHTPVSALDHRPIKASISSKHWLDFLWLELTNRCNLQCVHCYTESNPYSTKKDLLTASDYEFIMRQAFQLGCTKIQFIGGEPQLNPDFFSPLMKANMIGFNFIEVFSNLTHLDDDTVKYAKNHRICFATSVYSDDAAEHDAVTRVRSSHKRTIANLRRLVESGIDVRAAIIVMNQTRSSVDRTARFLRKLGVRHIRQGDVREFGRGEDMLGRSAHLSGLCGHCWAGKLCIGPDGETYPCVMARKWRVGNVFEASLKSIVQSETLRVRRQTIFDTVWLPKLDCMKSAHADEAAQCSPDCVPCPESCNPAPPGPCGPFECPQSCQPVGCVPNFPDDVPPSCEPQKIQDLPAQDSSANRQRP